VATIKLDFSKASVLSSSTEQKVDGNNDAIIISNGMILSAQNECILHFYGGRITQHSDYMTIVELHVFYYMP